MFKWHTEETLKKKEKRKKDFIIEFHSPLL